MRIEPPPSVPSAPPARPAATAAAEPPLEPPGVRCRSHGLRVTPKVGDSVNGVIISSGTCVLPMITAPAARSRRTTSESAGRGLAVGVAAVGGDLAGDVDVVLDRDRHAEQRPPVAARRRASAWSASASARSRSTTRNALSRGSSARSARGRARPARARTARRRGDQVGLAGEAGEGEVGVLHGGPAGYAMLPFGGAARRQRALALDPGRGACTDAERRAAAWLRDELRAADTTRGWSRSGCGRGGLRSRWRRCSPPRPASPRSRGRCRARSRRRGRRPAWRSTGAARCCCCSRAGRRST